MKKQKFKTEGLKKLHLSKETIISGGATSCTAGESGYRTCSDCDPPSRGCPPAV